MPNHGRGASAPAEPDVPGEPPLPDLSGVDLQVLRGADDPVVTAAVDEVLRDPGRYTGVWWGNEGGDAGQPENGKGKLHCVPTQRRRAV